MGESLYELSSELQRINEEIITAEGEITPELETMLDGFTTALDKKTGGIIRWTLNLKGKQQAIQNEIDRLTTRKRMVDNLDKRLKNYVHVCMVKAGMKKLEYDTFTVAIQKNPPSVEIEDEEKIDGKYKEIVQVVKLDKKQILSDMKAGAEVEGAILHTDKTHLRVR